MTRCFFSPLRRPWSLCTPHLSVSHGARVRSPTGRSRTAASPSARTTSAARPPPARPAPQSDARRDAPHAHGAVQDWHNERSLVEKVGIGAYFQARPAPSASAFAASTPAASPPRLLILLLLHLLLEPGLLIRADLPRAVCVQRDPSGDGLAVKSLLTGSPAGKSGKISVRARAPPPALPTRRGHQSRGGPLPHALARSPHGVSVLSEIGHAVG
jgi:hypothetical protein